MRDHASGGENAGMRGLPRYAVPVFVGAFLLFQVQPIIARCILPWFGGSPSVWTTCMLFFQVLLLAGYAYSHWLIDRVKPGGQATFHAALIGLSLLALAAMAIAWGAPILPSQSWKPADSSQPVLRIIALLAVTVGLPYLVLATTSPLLQAWFSRRFPDISPYRLYTVSNVGSILALLSYPFLVEPLLPLRAQAWVWAAGYALFAVWVVYCAVDAGRDRMVEAAVRSSGQAEDAGPTPGWRLKLLWVGLPALACALFLAVTNQMCQEVAVIPFLWILPLTLYLLSFIICFYSERGYRRLFYLLALIVAVAASLAIIPRSETLTTRLQIVIYAAALFICCMVCHGELAALKPAPRRLTAFYLAMAIGGAMGGIFVGAIAPLIFHRYWELQLGLILCWAVGLSALWSNRAALPRLLPQIAITGSAIIAIYIVVSLPSDAKLNARDVAVARNFYGILQVSEQHEGTPDYHRRVMVHGRTIHGIQYVSEEKRGKPTSYYGAESGVGLALKLRRRQVGTELGSQALKVGITGLGIGTVAVFGVPGDEFRFYEINPDVVRFARDPSLFTYLADSKANVEIVLGDARISLERELRAGPEQYDVMILDAFSGDAVPAHLLTREAFALYLRQLRNPGGLLAIHVTNRVLDLKPVIWNLAESLGLAAVLVSTPGDKTMTFPSEWMLLSRDATLPKMPELASSGTTIHDPATIGVWTDDYHPLLPIMK
jgi:hypothetical protein